MEFSGKAGYQRKYNLTDGRLCKETVCII